MQRHRQLVSAAAAMLAWVAPASAAPPEPGDEIGSVSDVAVSTPAASSWILIDARDHASGTSGQAAVLLGVAHERGRSRHASLRVDCFDNVTTLHIDTAGLRLRSGVTVTYSLDGGPFRPASWQAGGDGDGLRLSGDRAVAFLTGLHGQAELRLAVARPLSVPLVLTFTVAGAEQHLGTIVEGCQRSAAPAISEVGR